MRTILVAALLAMVFVVLSCDSIFNPHFKTPLWDTFGSLPYSANIWIRPDSTRFTNTPTDGLGGSLYWEALGHRGLFDPSDGSAVTIIFPTPDTSFVFSWINSNPDTLSLTYPIDRAWFTNGFRRQGDSIWVRRPQGFRSNRAVAVLTMMTTPPYGGQGDTLQPGTDSEAFPLRIPLTLQDTVLYLLLNYADQLSPDTLLTSPITMFWGPNYETLFGRPPNELCPAHWNCIRL